MNSDLETPRMEVLMPLPRTLRDNALFVFLVTLGLVITGLVTASPHIGIHQRHLIAQRASEPNALGLEVLSTTEGVEFEPYLQSLYTSVRRNFLSNIPGSAEGGTKGLVVIRFQIQRDGTLNDKAMTFVARSRKKDMNEAAVNAIRAAAPFQRLPQGYTGTNLDLQFSFYYNSGPEGSVQKSKQKPGVVPIGTAVNQGVSIGKGVISIIGSAMNPTVELRLDGLSDSRRLITL